MSKEITILGQKVRLLQPDQGFRTGLDSVMLAAACPAGPGDTVLDMGAGVGGAGFALAFRVAGCHVTGIEVQQDYYDLAVQNTTLNDTLSNISFIHEDVFKYEVSSPDKRFNHVICNPPYMESGAHLKSPDQGKAIAKGHDGDDQSIKHWVDAAFNVLKAKGTLTIIHRADMTDKIIQSFGKRFGAVEIIPLWPKAGQEAKRVIIRAVKDRRSPARLHSGIILHDDAGNYTKEADAVLRDAKSL